jgi:general secretion pathway protein G
VLSSALARLSRAAREGGMKVSNSAQSLRESGFTLLEIMVVVVIIGLLAAIVAPNFIGQIDTATIARVKQDVRNIETAVQMYRLQNLKYPNTEDGLEALVSNPGESVAPNWKQNLPRVPKDPWGNEYHYLYPGQESEFDIFSYGADGQEGGEGVNADIGNWNLDE